MDAHHGRHEVGYEGGVAAGEELVPDGDAGDLGGGNVGFDAGRDPLKSLVWIR